MNPGNISPQNSVEKSTEVVTQEKKLIESLNKIDVTSNDALSDVKTAIHNYHALSSTEVDRYHDLIDNIRKTFAEILRLPKNDEDENQSDLYARIKDNVLDICYVTDDQEGDTDFDKEVKNKKRQMVDKIREKVKEIVSISGLD